MKITQLIKTTVALILAIVIFLFSGIYSYADTETKLSKPKMTPSGTSYVQPKSKEISEKLNSDDKESVIYYSIDNKDPRNEGKVYTRPIPIKKYNENKVLKAINTKEGFLDSDVAECRYISVSAAPLPPNYGIKVSGIRIGSQKIKGTLKMDSISKKYKLVRYIQLTVKTSKGKPVKYNTKVKNGGWSVKLRSAVKKGSTVSIDAYTKDCVVCFEKADGYKENTINVYSYAPNWVRVTQKVE